MGFPATSQVSEQIYTMGEAVLKLIEGQGAQVLEHEPDKLQALFHRFEGAAQLYQFLYGSQDSDARAVAHFQSRVQRAYLQACFTAKAREQQVSKAS